MDQGKISCRNLSFIDGLQQADNTMNPPDTIHLQEFQASL